MQTHSGKSIGAREIAVTALLLAVGIASQFLKSLSIFITGPIVNVCIILAVLAAGLPSGLILSVITPITAYFIAASPVMLALPGIVPFIIGGNAVLAVMTYFLCRKQFLTDCRLGNGRLWLYSLLSALAKGAFMGLTISLLILPVFLPAASPLRSKLPVFQTTFSLYQFLTACIGFVYAFLIWRAARHVVPAAK